MNYVRQWFNSDVSIISWDDMTTMIEALELLRSYGNKTLDIYFAEMIDEDTTDYIIDVMCDEINNITGDNWTWEIWSLDEMKKFFDDDEFFVCDGYDILTDKPFSDDVVRVAVTNWLLANGFDMTVRVIDVDDAAGSGYVRELRNMDLEWETNNSTPLVTLVNERDGNV